MPPTGWKEKDDRTIAEIREYLDREHLDAFIPWKVPHLAYLMNYYDPLHAEISWEEGVGVLVIPREGEAFIVGQCESVAGLSEFGVAPWWLGERHTTKRPGLNALRGTGEFLKKMGLASGRIGLEFKWTPAAACDFFRSALPDVEFVAADVLVPRMRFIKTTREHELLKRAAEIGLASMQAYMRALREGATVAGAQLVRAQYALEAGGEWVGGAHKIAWTGGTDETPAWWDEEARERFLSSERRDWRANIRNVPCCVTHLETRFQFYYSDLAWHEFLGPAPDDKDVLDFSGREVTFGEARRDFEILRRIQREALAKIEPGMSQWDARKAVDAFLASDREAGDHITHYYIHGVGLEIHEEPLLHTPMPDSTPLDGPVYFRPGAVVSSEWFTRLWTAEEPFVMTDAGWEPLVELRGLTDPQFG